MNEKDSTPGTEQEDASSVPAESSPVAEESPVVDSPVTTPDGEAAKASSAETSVPEEAPTDSSSDQTAELPTHDSQTPHYSHAHGGGHEHLGSAASEPSQSSFGGTSPNYSSEGPSENFSATFSGNPGGEQSSSAPPASGQQAAENGFFTWLRGLNVVRGNDRWVGGVASGVAARLGIDPIIVRGIVVVTSIFFGIGLLAYGVAWALLPEPDGRIHVQEVSRGTWSSGMTGAAIFVLLGVLPFWRGLIFLNIFDSAGWFPWPLIWIAGIIAVIIWAVNRGKTSRPEKTGPTPYRPAAPGNYTPPAAPYQSFSQQAAGASPTTKPTSYSHEGNPQATYQQSSFTAPVSTSYPSPLAVKPPRPRHQSAGPVIFSITLGAAILVAGAIFSAELLGLVSGPIAVLAWASAGVICGVGIVIAALRGRSSGGLGFFAVCALIVASVLALLPSIPSNADWTFARTTNWSASDVSEIHQGFVVSAGTGLIDLRGLKAPQEQVVIPVLINAGSVEISVPKNLPVEIKNDLLAGSAESWDFAANGNQINKQRGSNRNTSFQVNPGATGPAVVFQVSGLGSLSVISYQEEKK